MLFRAVQIVCPRLASDQSSLEKSGYHFSAKDLYAGYRYVSTLTCACCDVYIANLPGKRLVMVGPSG
jgi:hypothetical protein